MAELRLGLGVDHADGRSGRLVAGAGDQAIDTREQDGDLPVGDAPGRQVGPVELGRLKLLAGDRDRAGPVQGGQPQVEVGLGEAARDHAQPPSSSSRRPWSQGTLSTLRSSPLSL
jgi:hypothetical protein